MPILSLMRLITPPLRGRIAHCSFAKSLPGLDAAMHHALYSATSLSRVTLNDVNVQYPITQIEYTRSALAGVQHGVDWTVARTSHHTRRMNEIEPTISPHEHRLR